MADDTPERENFHTDRRKAPEKMPDYDTETLFAGQREIAIHHAGSEYRMKITRQGKLILNK